MMLATRTIAKKMRREDRRLHEIVSAALGVTVGSYTIQCDKYDVDENAGSVDGIGRTR